MLDLPDDLFPALLIAQSAHEDQLDKAGQPYILHPIRVAMRVSPYGSEAMVMGLLHDVLEDSPYTAWDLLSAGISQEVVLGVRTLTHWEGLTRAEYEAHILAAPEAVRRVKLADVLDNSDERRPHKLSDSLALRYYNLYRALRESFGEDQ